MFSGIGPITNWKLIFDFILTFIADATDESSRKADGIIQ